MNLGRYFHTLRYLRPIQFYGRLAQHLPRCPPKCSPPPELRHMSEAWSPTVSRRQSLVGPASFVFLNEGRSLDFPSDWDSPDIAKLWRYNLHYFDDLSAIGSSDRSQWQNALMDRWIVENPVGIGTGWEPYPLSIRIVNWIKLALSGRSLSAMQVHSLAIQVRYLTGRLEWHLLGNHLLTNAKALIFAGIFFSGTEAENWLRSGLRVLEKQLPEQILSDGAHYELSPMYHSLMLEDLLDLINLYVTYGMHPPSHWWDITSRMGGWLSAMTHPDGEITFFNDAAQGIAPTPVELAAYANRLGLNYAMCSPCATASGYARLETDGAVLFMDLAPVGPDFLPGHAHADTLSFEFSLRGQRLMVNSGTSVYGQSAERERQRGTAAHNTVRVDGLDSSEVWHGFRVARRAKSHNVECGAGTAAAMHDGYQRLPGCPEHHRRWQLGSGELTIKDEVAGLGHHRVEAYFHLHPFWRVEGIGSRNYRLTDSTGMYAELELDTALDWDVQPSTWHPHFGVSVSNVRFVGTYIGQLPVRFTTRLTWPCAY